MKTNKHLHLKQDFGGEAVSQKSAKEQIALTLHKFALLAYKAYLNDITKEKQQKEDG